jgi:hypothetical protein
MTAQPVLPRVSRGRFFTGAWLTLLTVFVVINQVRFSALNDAIAAAAARSDVAELQEQVAFHSRIVTDQINAPPSASDLAFNTAREKLDYRLSEVETLTGQVQTRVGNLEALQAQVRTLEARWAKAHRTPVSAAPQQHAPPVAPSKSLASEPPFTPLSIELRGGERFLSIAPAGVSSLCQARVLRTGDSEGGWTLVRLEGRVAVFQVAGQLQRITVP